MPSPNTGKPEPRATQPASAAPPLHGLQKEMAEWRNAAPTPPPGVSSGPDLPGLISALRRRWMVALSLGIICAGLAGTAVYFLVTPRYTAAAQVQIRSTGGWNQREMSRSEYNILRKTEASRMKSRLVLINALKRDEVKNLPLVQQQPDPLIWLDDELKSDVPEDSEITTLSMMGTDPETIVKIVQAVYQAYLHEVTTEEPQMKQKRLAELNDILSKKNQNLKQKRDLFKQRADDLGTLDSAVIAQKQVYLRQLLNDATRQLSIVQGDLRRAEAKLKTHEAQKEWASNQPIAPALLNEAVESDAQGKDLLKRIGTLEFNIREYEKVALRKNETRLVLMRETLAGLQKSLAERTEEIRKEVVKRAKERTALDFDMGLAQLKTEHALASDSEKLLVAQVKSLSEEANKIGGAATELEMIRDEIKLEGEAVERLTKQAGDLELDLRSPPRINPNQDAGIQKKDVKRWLMALIGAPLAAFVFACFGVAFFEFRSRRVQSTDEVAVGLGIRVIGSVPALSKAAQKAGGEEVYEHELLESIDGIRTLLLRDSNVEGTQLVMVTSAVSGEGKTTLASHLATSLARAGRRTLLVDCDLRRPAAHQLFELPLQPGFSEVLMNEAHVAEAVRSTPLDGLWVMPAGQWDREVMQALARDGGSDIFTTLKNDYDFIIVDSHPVLPATDSLLIGQHMDAVLMSLLKDVSQTPRVYAAGQRLSSLGIRVLGAVVNGMKSDDYGGGYVYTAQPAAAAA